VPCYHYINEKGECVAEESTEPLDMELCTDTDDNIPTEILIGSNETEWGFAYCCPRVACVDNAKPQTDTELSSGVGIKEVYKEISSSNSNSNKHC
jgi:hypothetical protein